MVVGPAKERFSSHPRTHLVHGNPQFNPDHTTLDHLKIPDRESISYDSQVFSSPIGQKEVMMFPLSTLFLTRATATSDSSAPADLYSSLLNIPVLHDSSLACLTLSVLRNIQQMCSVLYLYGAPTKRHRSTHAPTARAPE